MRDYKFDPVFADRPRKRGKSISLVLGVLVLAGSIGWVYLDGPSDGKHATTAESSRDGLQATTQPETTATPEVLTNPLALPAQGEAGSTAPAAVSPDKPSTPSLLQGDSSAVGIEQSTLTVTEEAVEAEDGSVALEETTELLPVAAELSWEHHTIKSGESLARIFKAQGLSPSLLHSIVHSSDLAATLADIRPGQELRFQRDGDGELQQLLLIKNPVESLSIRAEDEGFESELISKAVETRIATATGTIESSLFVDAQKAGLSDGQIMELAALFGWDVDFALEIRAGDQFRMVYEEQYLDGKKYRNGEILAAEFVNQGKTYTAFRFEDSKGNIGYYDADGRNKRRAFIRTPIKFARVSSRFNPNRLHPVLKTKRPHRGVDYAAPTGTPIKATGAGKVVFRGRKGGYGNVVIVQHGGKYQTLYAHMSKFASKAGNGSRVKQGQIIGYVGQTGLASGPHLHYEFRVDGVHRNPLTVKLPKSLPLPAGELVAFKQHTAPLLSQLDEIRQATMVASNR